MISISTMITALSVVIAIISAAIAAITLQRNKEKDTKVETKEIVEVHAGLQSQIDILSNTIAPRLDTIDDGIRDLKAENRSTRAEFATLKDQIHEEMRSIHDEANHALELAEAAHRRLDRIGAEPDKQTKKEE